MVESHRADDIVDAKNLSKVYVTSAGATIALGGVDFRMRRGEFVSLLGPSGCGKSTLLNIVAGLIDKTAGQISYDGTPVKGPNTKVGYMTQSDTILPWKTVRANIELPLLLRGVPRKEGRARAEAMITLVGLEGFEDSFPSALSGGMKKRVGLAQAMVYEPETLLLDEPFAALDAILRLRMQAELIALTARMQGSVLFVTHDMDEAITLSDRVVVMSARPARIVEDVKVDLARPREFSSLQFTDEYQKVRARIWKSLSNELKLDGRGGHE